MFLVFVVFEGAKLFIFSHIINIQTIPFVINNTYIL